MSHPKYRPDIDGLRAIAVLAVVIFHAFPSLLNGGYAGVDVFFVISGFLISTILFQSIDIGAFSLADFYSRRVRRIFPALAVVLICVLFLGWFLLFPEEFKQLGKHVVASVGFVQNIVLWSEAGYFDNASDTKPLLHIWSLGVEEQFYLLWPLFLWGAGKLGGLNYKKVFYLLVIFLVFIISFILNLNLIHIDPSKTFYLPQYRFWELAFGGMVSWVVLYGGQKYVKNVIQNIWVKNGLSVLGVLGLILIFVKFNKNTVFPGKNALLPVFASAAIILAGPGAFLNKKILSHKVLVWIGLISFPLYLWHWPIISFGRIFYGDEPKAVYGLFAIVLSIGLSWLTVKVVEKPIRYHHSRKKIIYLCVLMLVIGVVGQHIKDHSGIKNRGIVNRNSTIETGNDGGDQGNLIEGCGVPGNLRDQFPADGCQHDKRENPTVALIGDSKSTVLVGGMVRNSDEKSRILFIGGSSKFGSPNPYARTKGTEFNLLAETAIETINKNENIKIVVMAYATRLMFGLKSDKNILDLPESKNFNPAYENTNQFIQRFLQAGKKVVLVVDNPTLPEPTDCLPRNTGIDLIDNIPRQKSKACFISYDQHMELSKQYRDLLFKIQSEHPDSVSVFDTVPLLCDMNKRSCSMMLNNRNLYSFSDHISDYAAGLIGEKLMPFIQGRVGR